MLWFEHFDAFDRVRLWNSLVFSENYFNYVGFHYRFKRNDIKKDIGLLKDQVRKEIELANAKRLAEGDIDPTLQHNVLTVKEKLRIRDKYYNPKVML